MNKLFISSTTVSNLGQQISKRVKIPISNKNESNIHYYFVDNTSTELWEESIFTSTNNSDVHTIVHINPKDLMPNDLEMLHNLTDHIKTLGVHVFFGEDFTEPTNMVNSIARIPEYV